MSVEKYRFVFIVLNYNSTMETMRCIDSLQKLYYQGKNIVVVDNASDNQKEALAAIEEHCKSMENIHILKNERNLGYACGNNIGIDYARRILKADFVCVVNPDTIVNTETFVENCIELYTKYRYSVCGPKIINNGENKNPIGGYNESIWYTIHEIFINYKIIVVKKFGLNRFNFFKRYAKKRVEEVVDGESSKEYYSSEEFINSDILIDRSMKKMLSGACLVFSPAFFEEFTGFCSKTFLYCEERILTCVCLNMGKRILYSEKIEVIHEGGKSMENTEKNRMERQIRVAKNRAKSDWVVLNIMLHKSNKKRLREFLVSPVANFEIFNGELNAR